MQIELRQDLKVGNVARCFCFNRKRTSHGYPDCVGMLLPGRSLMSWHVVGAVHRRQDLLKPPELPNVARFEEGNYFP